MTPLVLVLMAPGPLVDVRPAAVDGVGGEELVLSTLAPQRAGPAGLTLTILRFEAGGGEAGRSSIDLPPEAAWWDAGHGVWLLDGEGLLRLPGRDRIAAFETPLSWMGPTTPAHAGLVVDLDRDDRAELLLWAAGAVHAVGEDGARWGSVPAPMAGSLSAQPHLGGQALAATLRAPPVAVDDVDGDGLQDLIVVGERRVDVYRTTPGALGAVSMRWPLPAVLARAQDDVEAGWTVGARWLDLTGDGRTDLLATRIDPGSGLTTAEAELQLFVGTGSALSGPQVVRTGAGSLDIYPIDLDGDGDLDVLVPQVSADVGALAQAVLTQSFDAALVAYPMEDGRLGAPRTLHRVRMSLDGAPAAWSLFSDLTGDGRPDLAVLRGGRLRCYASEGTGIGLSEQPWVDVAAPVAAENLWAVDLTGDGRAELVAWSPGDEKLLVVRL